MKEEILDYVDEQGHVLGQVSRSEIDEKGLIGRISGVLIHNSKKEVMLSQNPFNKVPNGGKWHFSAIGHVSSGETLEDAAIKEAFEEVGAKVENLELILCQKNIEGKNRGKRLIYIFKAKYDGKYKLDKNEAIDYCFMSYAKIDEKMRTDKDFFSQDFIRFWELFAEARS